MRNLSDTIARLNAGWKGLALGPDWDIHSDLQPIVEFGSNPGALAGWCRVPAEAINVPLVIVLHGCTQTAPGYGQGSGWTELADRFGFALLLPEQTRANNPNGCFNWFMPQDIRRDGGEAASIRQMIAAMVDRHSIDPDQVFITGLSAGGAMTSVMLATYPEIFAGGAIVAGLPYGAAATMPQALDRMRGHGHLRDEAGAAAIRSASPHAGPWPRVSVWHGSADRTVDPVNADRVVGQWRLLQGLAAAPDRSETIDRQSHRIWTNANDQVQLEEYRIAGMGHGTPIRIDGVTACGTPMPFILDAGISSSWHIAQGWNLLNAEQQTARPSTKFSSSAPSATPLSSPKPGDIQSTIEGALRAAGLLR